MSEFRLEDVRETRTVRDQYGDEVILYDEEHESVAHRILSEFVLGEKEYVVLQSDALKKDDEVAIFRVGLNNDREVELETIEDDDEWENVAEIYDEMTLPTDDE